MTADEEDGQRADIREAEWAYREKFGDVPTIASLSSDIFDRAAELLTAAVEQNLPFASDGEWYAALGIEAPPDEDLI